MWNPWENEENKGKEAVLIDIEVEGVPHVVQSLIQRKILNSNYSRLLFFFSLFSFFYLFLFNYS